MRKILFAVLAYIVLSASSCATFDGFIADMDRISTIGSSVGIAQSPADVCEPIYRNDGAGKRYRQCLENRLMEQASPDEWQFGKVYPKCEEIYRNHKGEWNKYCSCQEDGYRRHVVSPKVQRIVSRRVALTKRSGQ